jgi:protein-L-isoaspartate(D-aspartate) O-methyltransferase
VELEPSLAATGEANLALTHQPWASIVPAVPGQLGLPEHAPYDRILVSAEARQVPRALVDQLADPGVLVVPVSGTMLRVVVEDGEERVTEHGWYRFVPLR